MICSRFYICYHWLLQTLYNQDKSSCSLCFSEKPHTPSDVFQKVVTEGQEITGVQGVGWVLSRLFLIMSLALEHTISLWKNNYIASNKYSRHCRINWYFHTTQKVKCVFIFNICTPTGHVYEELFKRADCTDWLLHFTQLQTKNASHAC